MQLLVAADLASVTRVLQVVRLDVLPELLDYLWSRELWQIKLGSTHSLSWHARSWDEKFP
jgi:hypothetical protein